MIGLRGRFDGPVRASVRTTIGALALTTFGCVELPDPEGRARDVPMGAGSVPSPPAPPAALPSSASAPTVAGPGAAGPNAWDPATTHAVIVGVLSFADPKITPFPARNRKDQELADVLVARGVARDRITLLLDGAATADAMLSAVEARARAAGPGSTLLVYYAGHGTKTESGEVGFLTYDASAGSAFSTQALGRSLVATFRGAQVLLLADCCHSGALAQTAAELQKAGIRAASVTSAEAANTSTVNWTFTQTVIDALRGDALADRDADGAVELGELATEVRDAMKHRERQRGGAALGLTPADLVLARVATPRVAAAPGTGGPAIGSYVEAKRGGAFAPARVVARPSPTTATVEHYDYSDKSRVDLATTDLRAMRFDAYPAGSKLRVTWGGKTWDADVVRQEEGFHLITYPGWSSWWDEWIASDRIVSRR